MFNLKIFEKNIKLISEIIASKQADGLLIDSEQNRFWLLNLKASAGYVYVSADQKVTLLIDGRYYESAHKKLSPYIDVRLMNSEYKLSDLLQEQNCQKILLESEYASLSLFKQIEDLKIKVDLFQGQALRIIKDQHEIDLLQKAADLAVNVTEFIKLHAKPGMSEIEVANMATIKFLELGAKKNSFDVIVASGVNGANPHHSPTEKKLAEHEMVTLDLGCVYEGYCSDMTRTFAVANSKLPVQLENIHYAVLQSQITGLETVKANISCKTVDLSCRRVLEDLELGKYFVHSTGHGLGIDVHELPNIFATNEFMLEENMVITVEPGIYIPEVGGVRIEDSVVVKEKGCLNLNEKASKQVNW